MRPLVVRFGSMGDMVIVLALIRALHRRFGTLIDVVSSGSWTQPLLASQPGVGRLYLIRSRKMPYLLSLHQWQLVKALRRRGVTPTWICDADDKCRWLIARAGVPASHIVDVRAHPRRPGEHAVDYYLRLSRATPLALAEEAFPPTDDGAAAPPIEVPAAWRSDADRWLERQGLAGRPLVLIQVGNRRTTRWGRPTRRATNTKYWPESSWARVIDAVAGREPDADILLCGVRTEAGLNDAILRLAKTTRARNVARDLPLHRLLALEERARGMISVDTGPAHSAAALGCPLVVLFGTADPTFYMPRSPTGAVVCVRASEAAGRAMRSITEEEVLAAWEALRQQSQGAVSTAPAPASAGVV